MTRTTVTTSIRMLMGARLLIALGCGPTMLAACNADSMEASNEASNDLLMIGLDPKYVDYAMIPGLDEQTLSATLKLQESQLNALGYNAEWCLIDTGQTAEAQILERLGTRNFDCILIGAGVRTLPANFLLFERVINLVHARAPQAKLCFNEGRAIR